MEISPVEFASFPNEVELTLSFSAFEPVVLEVVALSCFWDHGFVDETCSAGVVCDDWSGRLLVAHFLECNAQWQSCFAVIEQSCDF